MSRQTYLNIFKNRKFNQLPDIKNASKHGVPACILSIH